MCQLTMLNTAVAQVDMSFPLTAANGRVRPATDNIIVIKTASILDKCGPKSTSFPTMSALHDYIHLAVVNCVCSMHGVYVNA